MIAIDRVATVHAPGTEPSYAHHGYCITPDGTVYALGYQWYHGVVLALLYPEVLAQYRDDYGQPLVIPDDRSEINVHEFQRFELQNHGQMSAVRICPSRMLGPTSIDRPKNGCTAEQITAVRAIFKVLGLGARDIVNTDSFDVRVSNIWDYLLANSDNTDATLAIIDAAKTAETEPDDDEDDADVVVQHTSVKPKSIKRRGGE